MHSSKPTISLPQRAQPSCLCWAGVLKAQWQSCKSLTEEADPWAEERAVQRTLLPSLWNVRQNKLFKKTLPFTLNLQESWSDRAIYLQKSWGGGGQEKQGEKGGGEKKGEKGEAEGSESRQREKEIEMETGRQVSHKHTIVHQHWMLAQGLEEDARGPHVYAVLLWEQNIIAMMTMTMVMILNTDCVSSLAFKVLYKHCLI